MPRPCAATNTRERSKTASVFFSASPSLPIMLAAGTRTSVRKICAVDWPLLAILWISRTSYGCSLRSSTKCDRPRRGSSLVRTVQIRTSEYEPLLIQVFSPLRM